MHSKSVKPFMLIKIIYNSKCKTIRVVPNIVMRKPLTSSGIEREETSSKVASFTLVILSIFLSLAAQVFFAEEVT